MNQIEIPSLSHGLQDLEVLSRLIYPACAAGAPPSILTFDACTFITPIATAYLGGLLRLAAHRHVSMTAAWYTLPKETYAYAAQTGLLARHGAGSIVHHGHSVPYREDAIGELSPDLPLYLESAWLNHPWLHLSMTQCRMIVGRLLEIYSNASDHSASPVGIFTAGQHYPKKQTVLFSMIDLGLGIPARVQAFLNQPNLEPTQALTWAFQRGHTTRPTRPRGLGLDILASFVRTNDGRLDVVSGRAHMAITARDTRCEELSYMFPGTAVSLGLRCDRHFYTSPALSSPALTMTTRGPSDPALHSFLHRKKDL